MPLSAAWFNATRQNEARVLNVMILSEIVGLMALSNLYGERLHNFVGSKRAIVRNRFRNDDTVTAVTANLGQGPFLKVLLNARLFM